MFSFSPAGRLWLAALSAVVLGLGLCACGSDQRNSNTSEREIASKAQSWKARAIADYTLVYREICYCLGGDVTVVVRGGQVDHATQESYDGTSFAINNPLTVDSLFDILLRAQRDADDLTVRFDEDLDYPESVSIDWLRDAVDEEFGVTVLRLTPE